MTTISRPWPGLCVKQQTFAFRFLKKGLHMVPAIHIRMFVSLCLIPQEVVSAELGRVVKMNLLLPGPNSLAVCLDLLTHPHWQAGKRSSPAPFIMAPFIIAGFLL